MDGRLQTAKRRQTLRYRCRSSDGADVSRPNYAEGGLAAVSELQWKLRDATGLDAQSAAEDLLATWKAERRASEDRGAAWVAYRNGGVAQLRIVVADLAEVASS